MPRVVLLVFALAWASPALAAGGAAMPWWIWPLALFAVTFALGVVAVLAGVGGGVLFVPIVGGFFPFHLDFVRGAGLLLALTGALSAGPALLRSGLGSLRLAMPLALVGSVTSIAGALLGFVLPVQVMEIALGVTILAIAALMAFSAPTTDAAVFKRDPLGAWLGLHGQDWRVHRTPSGLAAFAVIGLIGGLFGLGAGWANVPTLYLLMGAPLKLAVGTSTIAISIINSSAAWIYLGSGAVLPIIVAPSVVGVMLGARLGVRLLHVAPVAAIRHTLVFVLLAAGARALLKGTGVWD